MKRLLWTRLHAAGGIGYLLVNAVMLLVAPIPVVFGAPETEIVSFYQRYKEGISIQIFLIYVALLFLVWFLGYLSSLLRRLEEPTSPLPMTMLVGGILWVALQMADAASFQQLSMLTNYPLAHAVLRGMSDFAWLYYGFSAFPGIVVVGAASLSAWRLGLWPRWFCWLGLLVIAIEIPSCLTLVFPSIISPSVLVIYGLMVMFGLWCALASLLCLLREPVRVQTDQQISRGVPAQPALVSQRREGSSRTDEDSLFGKGI